MAILTTPYFHSRDFERVDELRGLGDCVEYDYFMFLDWFDAHGYMCEHYEEDFPDLVDDFRGGLNVFKVYLFRGYVVRYEVFDRSRMLDMGCVLGRYFPIGVHLLYDLGFVEDVYRECVDNWWAHYIYRDVESQEVHLLGRDMGLLEVIEMDDVEGIGSIRYKVIKGVKYL